MRTIGVVTGTRAEYGLLSPVLKAIERHPELELCLIVAGMHLSPEFGYTAREIERDGFKIDVRIDTLLSSDTGAAMAKSLGIALLGITQAFEKRLPDIILVLGDRGEALAAAIAGTHMNIPVAHIHGGEVTKGMVDESIRHSITKFAHIHFPATKQSAERIIKLGEEEDRIHVVGAPALDIILNEELVSPEVLAEEFHLDLKKPIIMLAQHPVTTQAHQAAEQMTETVEALIEMKQQTIIIYPNADAGGRSMVEVIKKYEKLPFIQTYRSLPYKVFLSLMRIATVMVGNSSSGIIESASFGLPIVNIGIRQEGRQRADNIIDVPHERKEIAMAVKKAIEDEEFRAKAKGCENPYGDGKTGRRIAHILSRIEIEPSLLCKKITY